MSISELLQRLRDDNTSGASTLLDRAVDILDTFAGAEQPRFQDHDDFRQALAALLREVMAAQPSMAPMINLAQQALQACPAAAPATAAPERLRQALTAFRQHMHQSTAALCRQVVAILPSLATVLTYSNSSTVVTALQQAHEQGRVGRVLLSESRPACDGRPEAQALLQHGIEVEYTIDMGLFERLAEAQVVLVGADAVFPHGLVNKLGTRALAQIARLQHVPMYSLSTTSKFLPADAAPLLHVADHPGDEVWPDAPAGLHIRNSYFDTTPLDLFTGIVCEHGIYAPAALQAHLQRQELAPVLRSRVPHGTN